VHSVRVECSDANLNTFRVPFPNPFCTRPSVGDSEHVPEGMLAAGAVLDRVSLLRLVVSNHPVMLGTSDTLHFTEEVTLLAGLLPRLLIRKIFIVHGLAFFFLNLVVLCHPSKDGFVLHDRSQDPVVFIS
jgi:hypothetical protein